MPINDEQETGDCFIVAFKLALKHGWTLCHGTVVRPADGLHHQHAWCEGAETRTIASYMHGLREYTYTDTYATDRSNGNDVTIHASLYRNLGRAHNIVEYTPDEARAHALRTGHYGPWEVGDAMREQRE
jgi:hypothetical protein